MKNSLLVHKHLIVRAEAVKPPKDEDQLKEWMKEFVDSINMKIFMGPYVKYCNMEGNRGITAVAIRDRASKFLAGHVVEGKGAGPQTSVSQVPRDLRKMGHHDRVPVIPVIVLQWVRKLAIERP